MKRPRRELEHEAKVATMEILRSLPFYKDRNDLTKDQKVTLLSHEVMGVLLKQDSIIDAILGKSMPQPKGSGSSRWGREQSRTRNISTRNGFGFGCTICDGDLDTKTFMSLEVGNWRMKMLLDLCLPCAKRLLNVVEARFEDRRNVRFLELPNSENKEPE